MLVLTFVLLGQVFPLSNDYLGTVTPEGGVLAVPLEFFEDGFSPRPAYYLEPPQGENDRRYWYLGLPLRWFPSKPPTKLEPKINFRNTSSPRLQDSYWWELPPVFLG